jgi:hypothetical protein
MDARLVKFGLLEIDGERYDRDVVIEGGVVQRRKKKASKRYRDQYGHTPLSVEEPIPWDCRRLVVGTGAHGLLPVMDEVYHEAKRRGVELVVCTTAEACDLLREAGPDTNAVLHVTC